jgi:putative flavoprotein involved in K+ transport
MTRRYDTVVVGGGQAGLATGYYLKQQGRNFIILDGSERIGDSWRARWDSLRLFTPARYNGLPGMPFPAPPDYFPPKDEVADFLEYYAEHFELPVELNTRVERLTRYGERFLVTSGEQRFEADNVVVAMAPYQVPRIPAFAGELDPGIIQMHSADYCSPDQLQKGGVLVVGAGNSGSEIGLEVARTHPTWLSGRDVGHIPYRDTRRPVFFDTVRDPVSLPPRDNGQHAHWSQAAPQAPVPGLATGARQTTGYKSRRDRTCSCNGGCAGWTAGR